MLTGHFGIAHDADRFIQEPYKKDVYRHLFGEQNELAIVLLLLCADGFFFFVLFGPVQFEERPRTNPSILVQQVSNDFLFLFFLFYILFVSYLILRQSINR